MKAFKCDRCQAFYPAYPTGKGLFIGSNYEPDYENRPFDLCPDCSRSLSNWFKMIQPAAFTPVPKDSLP